MDNEHDQEVDQTARLPGPSRFITRDHILEAKDLVTEEVDVPEWGGKVLVRSLTGTERDRYEDQMIEQRGRKSRVSLQNARARLVVLCVVDADGNRLFRDQDAKALGRKSAAVLTRIYEVAQRLSGLSDEDVEELRGNSDDGQDEGSPSA